MPHFEQPSRTIRFEPFEAHLRARELRKHGVRVRISGQPFEVLALLLERPGDVVTRKELQERLWPGDTFVDFEHGVNNAIKKLRAALGDSAEEPLYVETLARVGYRFIAPVARPPRIDQPLTRAEAERSEQGAADSGESGPGPAIERGGKSFVSRVALATTVVAVVAALAGWQVYRAGTRKPVFNERVSVVVADFVNTTGDPTLDSTLREGMEVDLGQSPFLDVMPRPQIWAAMQMMGRSSDEKLTDRTGLEICQRANAQALLAGSVVGLGQHYVITVDALNCRTGDSLAVEQAEADTRSLFAPSGKRPGSSASNLVSQSHRSSNSGRHSSRRQRHHSTR